MIFGAIGKPVGGTGPCTLYGVLASRYAAASCDSTCEAIPGGKLRRSGMAGIPMPRRRVLIR